MNAAHGIESPPRPAPRGWSRIGLALLVVGPLVAVAACGTDTEDTPPLTPGADAAPERGPDAEETYPTLPYPPGPYGLGIGEVMPNLVLQGYRLSRTQRDSRKLPFENISLAEVRSDPACTCMLLVFNPSGAGCPPCVEEDLAVASLVLRDRSICAAELVPMSFDAIDVDAGVYATPPTRADLDFITESAREPFPVGLPTSSVFAQPFAAINAFPDMFVMKPGDMKIAAFLQGSGNLERRVREACASPWPAVETLVTGEAAKHLAVDANSVYFASASRIGRLPREGGPITELARIAGDASALRLDNGFVYWSVGGAPSQIARAPKAGGAVEILTQGPEPYGTIALEGADVWFTKGNLVGHVPKAGGAETIFSTETAPTSLAVDPTTVYVMANHAVVARARSGGDNYVVVDRSVFGAHASLVKGRSVLLGADNVYADYYDDRGSAIIAVSRAFGRRTTWDVAPPATTVTIAPDGELYVGTFERTQRAAGIVHASFAPPTDEHTTWTLMGQEAAALAHDGTYAYWAEADRIRRIRVPAK